MSECHADMFGGCDVHDSIWPEGDRCRVAQGNPSGSYRYGVDVIATLRAALGEAIRLAEVSEFSWGHEESESLKRCRAVLDGTAENRSEPGGPLLSRGDERRVVSQPDQPTTEHVTDGSPCWCQPRAEGDGEGHVLIHRGLVQ